MAISWLRPRPPWPRTLLSHRHHASPAPLITHHRWWSFLVRPFASLSLSRLLSSLSLSASLFSLPLGFSWFGPWPRTLFSHSTLSGEFRVVIFWVNPCRGSWVLCEPMWVWCCVRIKTIEVLGLWSKSQEAHGFGGILAVDVGLWILAVYG